MLDTNIIVSAIISKNGRMSLAIKEIIRLYKICICTFSIEELHLVMDRKFPNRVNDMEIFLNELDYELLNTPKNLPIEAIPYVRDEKDRPILATAILADVDVLLTGDDDLLAVDITRPKIINAKDFQLTYLLIPGDPPGQ